MSLVSERALAGAGPHAATPVISHGDTTGLGTQPFRTASGKLFMSFHCQLRESCGHHMEGRWLCFAPLEIASGIPTVHRGVPPITVVT